MPLIKKWTFSYLDIAPGHDGIVDEGDPLERFAEHARALHQRALEGEQVHARPVVRHRVRLAFQPCVRQCLTRQTKFSCLFPSKNKVRVLLCS